MTEEQMREIVEYDAERRRRQERDLSLRAGAFQARIANRTLDQIYLLASLER